jgi:thymidylate synthase
MANNLDKQYQALLKDILSYGNVKNDRTGTGCKSIFGYMIHHNMSEGFPLLTTKKVPFKTMATELMWFLKGDTNIKYLVDNNCHIWNGDAYKNYLRKVIRDKDIVRYLKSYSIDTKGVPTIEPYSKDEFIERIKNDDEFAKKWGELGPIYGKQWRSWDTRRVDNTNIKQNRRDGIVPGLLIIDQIANLINDLKTNPDSRRLMVNAWNVGELDQMVLPPCHYGFQVYTRELSFDERCKIQIDRLDGMYSPEKDIFIKSSIDEVKLMTMDKNNIPTRAISLMWNQRSVDTFLGLPFNIASYGLLLEIIAKEVNMVPDELIGNLGDVHLYSNHVEQAKEQIGRELTEEERYNIWFNNNYETGMERNFDPNNLPDYDDPYYNPTPKRTREPYPLPKLIINENNKLRVGGGIFTYVNTDFTLENYQSHPSIKAPLSN